MGSESYSCEACDVDVCPACARDFAAACDKCDALLKKSEVHLECASGVHAGVLITDQLCCDGCGSGTALPAHAIVFCCKGCDVDLCEMCAFAGVNR